MGPPFALAESARRAAVVVLRRPVAGVSAGALSRFVTQARRAAGLKDAVNVLITSNSELRSLNRRFRAMDKPTDVLSFPAGPDSSTNVAGEIAISAEIASRNARMLGHPISAELKILILHGILHLRGYDHERDQGQMANIEQQLRQKLRLPVGLIERTGLPKGKVGREAANPRRRS